MQCLTTLSHCSNVSYKWYETALKEWWHAVIVPRPYYSIFSPISRGSAAGWFRSCCSLRIIEWQSPCITTHPHCSIVLYEWFEAIYRGMATYEFWILAMLLHFQSCVRGSPAVDSLSCCSPMLVEWQRPSITTLSHCSIVSYEWHETAL